MAQFYDTLLGEYIKNPWQRGNSLDKIADTQFDYAMIKYDDVTQKAKINFKDVGTWIASIYSAEDVYITNKIFQQQKKQGINQYNILKNIELPLLPIIKQMEIDGVKISPDSLKWIWLLLDNEIRQLKKSIYDEVWEEFNINSPKQVWEILFEKMELPKGKKTKTGYSVNAEVLWDLAHDYPIAQKVVDYRHYSKLQSTYIDGLIEIADDNNFVHTSYNQTVTTTGRLSSTSPNLQNIPSSDGIAGEIREAFISRFEWWYIMAADYSQVEVRLLAIMSQDENLLHAFQKELDIHHKTAEFLFPWQTITASLRKIAKAVNFWVIYWISSFWLSKMIGIPMKDAKIYIDTFYKSYPKVRIFFDELIAWCEEKWYVETLYHRRRYIPWINDRNNIIKNAAKREAMNMPIQWTSADIIKIAMIEVDKYIQKNKLQSKMIMQVHDELVFDVHPDEKDILKTQLQLIMENILENAPIILKVDVEYWETWKQAK